MVHYWGFNFTKKKRYPYRIRPLSVCLSRPFIIKSDRISVKIIGKNREMKKKSYVQTVEAS